MSDAPHVYDVLRDAIQDILFYRESPPQTAEERNEQQTAVLTIRDHPTPIPVPGEDPAVWTHRLRRAALDCRPGPAGDATTAFLRDAQTILLALPRADPPAGGGEEVRVVDGSPPLTWLWDHRPLADDAWGNVQGFDDGSGDGHTISLRRWIPPGPVPLLNPLPRYLPGCAPLPPGYRDGGIRRFYIPKPPDLEAVRRHFPDLAHPANPDWLTVAGRIRVHGNGPSDLSSLSPPELLALLNGTDPPPPARPVGQAATIATAAALNAAVPFVPLTSWAEIIAALNEPHGKARWKNNERTRDTIRKFNEKHRGPIRLPQGKGMQPEVSKAALLEWWASLESRYQDWKTGERQETKDLDDNLSDAHPYGRSGTVLPGVQGSEKKRRTKKDGDERKR